MRLGRAIGLPDIKVAMVDIQRFKILGIWNIQMEIIDNYRWSGDREEIYEKTIEII